MPTGRDDFYSANGPIYAGRFSPVTQQLVLVGPTTGTAGSIATFFTVMHTGTLTSTVKITMSDGAGGQFWPLEYSADKSVTLSPTKSSAVFFYAPATSGVKSIALTNDGGLVNPSFSFTSAAYTAPSATPFRLTRGGTTIGSYATLQQCKDVGNYQSGDVVKCTGGNYIVYGVNDPGSLEMTNNAGGIQAGVELDTLTIEWETPGQPMILDYSRSFMASMWGGGQPQAFTVGATCRSMTLRGVHIRGARPPIGASWFGAAIWTKITNAVSNPVLNIEYCKIYECPDGIKTGDTSALTTNIRYSVFENNSDNRGLDHDIYTGKNALTLTEGCTFRKTSINPYPQLGMGHFLKSRCRATTVRGCLFDGWMSPTGLGGVAQTINTPNGGVVEIVGNVINYYGALSSAGNGNPLRYGDDQHTPTVDTSTNPLLTTHSLLFAQNTVRQYLGRSSDGTQPRVLALFPTGANLTTLLDGSGNQVPATATVRNNLVAYDSPGTRLTEFLSTFPDNTTVSVSSLTDQGIYSGSVVAGNPTINDAPVEWASDFTIPSPRSDTNRGGRTPYMPAWVPTTAWQWTNIAPAWTTFIKDNGTGVVPAIVSDEPSYSKSYSAQWDFSAPCYSRKNHEIWMFGGGHQATTINLLSKWNLHKDSPDVSVACAATDKDMRKANLLAFANTGWDTKVYFADGKPYSPHSYSNNMYSDAFDEFFSFGIAAMLSPGVSYDGAGPGWSSREIAGYPRNGPNWRAQGYYTQSSVTNETDPSAWRGPRFMSQDGSVIYYWLTGLGLNKFDIASKTHSNIGGGTIEYYSRWADEGTGRAMVLGSSNTGGAWLGQFVNLSNGALTPITITGDSLPTNLGIYDLAWCSNKGYYLAIYFNASSMYNESVPLTNIVVATITPTGSNTATASIKTLTGTGPTRMGSYKGAFYDPTYECLIVVTHEADPVKALKIN